MTKRELKDIATNLNAVDYSQVTYKPIEGDFHHVEITWKDSDGREFKKDQQYGYTRVIASSRGTYGCNGVIFQLFPSNVFVYSDNPYVVL